MFVRRYNSPRFLWLYQHGQAEIEVDQPVARGVLDVPPIGGPPAAMFPVPVATLKVCRQIPMNELLVPAAGGELVEVPDQNVVELLVCEMRSYAVPVFLQIVVFHAG